jgi:hypothetical protein
MIRRARPIALTVGLTCLAGSQARAQAIAPSRLSPAEYYQASRQARECLGRDEFGKAAELYERLVAEYRDDPRLWEALGDSRFNLKQYATASEAYRRALALETGDLSFDLYRIAQGYALAGDKKGAIEWLGRAVASGYERRSQITGDSAFASLGGDPLLSELAGDLPARDYSRDEGWRHDLAYLVSEVKRMHYVYRSRPLPAGFDEETASLREDIPQLTDPQIIVRLQGLVARLGDGHSNVYFPFGDRGLKQLPLRWYSFSDGLFVVSAPGDLAKWVGTRVVTIGDVDAAEALDRLSPFVSKDNTMFVRAIGTALFLRSPDFLRAAGIVPNAERVSLTLESRMGHRETIVLSPAAPGELVKYVTPSERPGAPPPPRYLARQSEPYWFEHLPETRSVYFQFNRVADGPGESLADFALRLTRYLDEHPVQNLIVDVRHNFGGNGELLAPLVRALIHFETTRADARLFVITGRTTFSAAQIFIAQVDRMTNAVFAGEPSSSSPNFVGEETPLVLPYSKLAGSISSRFHQSDGMDRRMWIAPEIPVALSSEDYFANRDPVLDAVLTVIRESGRPAVAELAEDGGERLPQGRPVRR